ncbi:hypothetical protein [Butyrivibrio fibrisolvens]|uniref:hypothetical protein n=1 Tax=Butyrivibrio fibrisolvens TaxID=831 RepID=UPI0003B74261|nr:hypothetical protein [Butyrivibrio fibrisolvens]
MIYTNSREEIVNDQFINPAPCYRGAPFWSWNGLITKEMIDEQIQYFKEMGFGGFHVHVRVGLKNEYLSDEFMDLIKYCVEKAKQNDMLCYLYDEDRYASGFGGGIVTKNPNYRKRFLVLTQNKNTEGRLLYSYILKREKEENWYAFEVVEKESPWRNNQTYVDTMNPEAIAYFLKITHERYKQVVGEEFGKTIPSIFTDEPNITGFIRPQLSDSKGDLRIPFTEELPKRFEKISGLNFFESLPYVFWDGSGSDIRYYLYEACTELYNEAYHRQIGEWCKENNIAYAGHILGEESLQAQADAVGEAMRHYKEFSLPGMDNLCDIREFTTAKQVTSVVHQYGLEGALSEEYGVTQWNFDFKGYKLAGDWQAALGITTRVHHLAWATMEGEAKRDYPAAIGWQSPWYKEFSYIEDYFGRVNYMLTKGKPVTQIGVIHPIESFWRLLGPSETHFSEQQSMKREFEELCERLLTGGFDFDYISEALANEDALDKGNGLFNMGQMEYSTVIVPSNMTLRKSTIKLLRNFAKTGGRLIVLKSNDDLNDIAETVASIDELIDKIDTVRTVDLFDNKGRRTDKYLFNMREIGDKKVFFMAQAFAGVKARDNGIWERRAVNESDKIWITFKGNYSVTRYNAITGDIKMVEATVKDGRTKVLIEVYSQDSCLLVLKELHEEKNISEKEYDNNDDKTVKHSFSSGVRIFHPSEYQNLEPNVYLIDTFTYKLKNRETQEIVIDNCEEEKEILQIDNLLRKKTDLPGRYEDVCQPYARKPSSRDYILTLSTKIISSINYTGAKLALEDSKYCKVFLNGREINLQEDAGYYVDRAIKCFTLSEIRTGENILEIQMLFGEDSNLERMYLLGEFGVELRGNNKKIVEKPEKLFWGDYTRQGFPFYTGNMEYYVDVPLVEQQSDDSKKRERILHIPYFAGAAVKVCIPKEKAQIVAFAPQNVLLHSEEACRVKLILLGNRYNGFGQLHLIGDDMLWLGPDSFRSCGDSFTSNYNVISMGIMSEPVILEVGHAISNP